MREELVRRLIAQASDDLVQALYRRIIVDQGQEPFSREGEELISWEELVDRAVQEGVLNREEAAHLFQEMRWGSYGKGGDGAMASFANDCPYLKRVGREVRYALEAYCQRSWVCGLRIPSLAEFRRFCTSGEYHRCPVYRFGTETNEEEISGKRVSTGEE